MNSLWSFQFSSGNLEDYSLSATDLTTEELIKTLPEGVYTTFRTREREYAFQLEAHLARLEESLLLSGYKLDFSLNLIRKPLRDLLGKQTGSEHRIRLHIPYNNLLCCFILVEEFIPPQLSQYQQGVTVAISRLERENPAIKRSIFIEKSQLEKYRIQKDGFEESILLGKDEQLLEGMSSNFFAVRFNRIYTAGEGVLAGVTRKLVLEEATRAGFEIIFQPVKLSDIALLDEAFITSTSRKVMPVVRIDKQIIGPGIPGETTRLIMSRFEIRFIEEFERI